VIKNYVISLRSANDRRNHIEKEFAKNKVDFEFFNAIEPIDNDIILNIFSIEKKRTMQLSNQELACLLSHLSLWQKAIDNNLEYIGVFEDDIFLGKNADYLLNNNEWLKGKDILKLEKFHRKAEFSIISTRIEGINRKIYKLLGKNLGTGGYILSSKGCHYMINYLKTIENIDPVDIFMFNQVKHKKQLPVFQLQPAIVIQDSILNPNNTNLSSSIYHNEKLENKKDNIVYKIKKETIRAIRSLRVRNIYFQ